MLIEQNVFQFSGEIKGGKRRGLAAAGGETGWGGEGGRWGWLNVILNDLRSTDSDVRACLLSAGHREKTIHRCQAKNIIPSPREAEENATNRRPGNLTVVLPEAFPWK